MQNKLSESHKCLAGCNSGKEGCQGAQCGRAFSRHELNREAADATDPASRRYASGMGASRRRMKMRMSQHRRGGGESAAGSRRVVTAGIVRGTGEVARGGRALIDGAKGTEGARRGGVAAGSAGMGIEG